jgi:hypothetical protein
MGRCDPARSKRSGGAHTHARRGRSGCTHGQRRYLGGRRSSVTRFGLRASLLSGDAASGCSGRCCCRGRSRWVGAGAPASCWFPLVIANWRHGGNAREGNEARQEIGDRQSKPVAPCVHRHANQGRGRTSMGMQHFAVHYPFDRQNLSRSLGWIIA